MRQETIDKLTLSAIALLLITWVTAWTTTQRVDVPGDTDDPSETPTFIRDTKSAFVERLDIDHYWTISAASTYDAADTGKHRFVTFREPNSISSVNADEGVLFTKDAS